MAQKQWVTIPEFAEHRGITAEYTRRLIRKGKISGNSLKKKGKRYLIHIGKAEQDLASNLSISHAKKAAPEAPKQTKKTEPDNQVVQTAEGISSDGIEHADFATAQTIEARYKAALKRLDYEQKTGQLIPADQVEEVWTKQILAARTKILAIKSKLAPVLKDCVDPTLFDNTLAHIDRLIAEVLEDLSGDEIS